MKYITFDIPRTMDEVIEKSMPRILKSYQDKADFGVFAAYLINSEKYIGWFQFDKDKEFKDSIEIGCRLKKQYWGNCYATEVTTFLCKLGIKIGKIIVARVMIENLALIRVMEKAGMKFVKEFWGYYEPHSGSPFVIYKI